MKITLIFGVFALIAFAVTTVNANLIRKPGEINFTAKFQKKLAAILEKISDPIVLSDKNIQLNMTNVELDVTLSGSISGIKALTVNDFKVSILGGFSISSFEFVVPKLTLDITSYDLDGILGFTPIFGKGQIFLNLENIVLKGSAKLKIFTVDEVQYVQIKSITVAHSLDNDKFNFNITGLLNDEYLSELLSNLINKVVKNMSPGVKTILDETIANILTTLLKDFVIPAKELVKP